MFPKLTRLTLWDIKLLSSGTIYFNFENVDVPSHRAKSLGEGEAFMSFANQPNFTMLLYNK